LAELCTGPSFFLSVAIKFNDVINFQMVAASLLLGRIGFTARVVMRHGIFTKRILFHLRICYVGALPMEAKSSKKVISKIVPLTVATFVGRLGEKIKYNS
jgi:hypothetical protein